MITAESGANGSSSSSAGLVGGVVVVLVVFAVVLAGIMLHKRTRERLVAYFTRDDLGNDSNKKRVAALSLMRPQKSKYATVTNPESSEQLQDSEQQDPTAVDFGIMNTHSEE